MDGSEEAGVVTGHVEPPEPGHHVVEQGTDGVVVGHVDNGRRGPSAGVTGLLRGAGRGVAVDIGADHHGAPPGEGPDQGLADPRAGTGDEHHAPVEPRHVVLPLGDAVVAAVRRLVTVHSGPSTRPVRARVPGPACRTPRSLPMAKRRDLIRMTDEEVWAFVDGQRSLQVATINRDGTPHLSTLWFAPAAGALVFETFTKSQKIKNLERDPRVTLLLEDGEVYEELRGVMFSGVAELHGDPEEVHRLAASVMIRNTPGIPEDLLMEAASAWPPSGPRWSCGRPGSVVGPPEAGRRLRRSGRAGVSTARGGVAGGGGGASRGLSWDGYPAATSPPHTERPRALPRHLRIAHAHPLDRPPAGPRAGRVPLRLR